MLPASLSDGLLFRLELVTKRSSFDCTFALWVVGVFGVDVEGLLVSPGLTAPDDGGADDVEVDEDGWKNGFCAAGFHDPPD